MSNVNELPEDRLATTDEHGNRVYLHPEDIKGKWKNRRTFFYWFLILLYLVLPWIYINGEQLILLDIPRREFHLFGNTFYGHDTPFLLFFILGFVFFIAFITSIWGRVWCGWACPQTVFIDGIFRKIEKLVEGKARQRRALDREPMSFKKGFKRSLKWFLYTLVSLHIVHSFLGYFVGTHKLFWITMGSPSEHWTLFVTMLVLTGIILFDFGWFKEQFCIIACPYGRFQSVFMDEGSTIVAYDKDRGEPRRSPDIEKANEGDCINCKRCVKACPTGIDIRDGLQMECIACTMCIDACDEIMTKIKKPTGLIKYTSETQLKGEKKKLGFRNFLYIGIFTIVVSAGLISLKKRQEINLQFLRSGQVPYSETIVDTQKMILNHFNVKINYYDHNNDLLDFELADTSIENYIQLVSPNLPLKVSRDNEAVILFVKYNPTILNNGRYLLKLNVVDKTDQSKPVILKQVEVNLLGPIN
jgi:cytochrome c oxidase accessory protein FixG